jgi:hypothetical protein
MMAASEWLFIASRLEAAMGASNKSGDAAKSTE